MKNLIIILCLLSLLARPASAQFGPDATSYWPNATETPATGYLLMTVDGGTNYNLPTPDVLGWLNAVATTPFATLSDATNAAGSATNKLDTDLRALATATTNGLSTRIFNATNNYNGSNILAGSINSNRLDAATLALISSGGGSGDVTAAGLAAGSYPVAGSAVTGSVNNSATANSLSYSSNAPLTGQLHSQWRRPMIAFDTWSTWQLAFNTYRSNTVERWVTNLANTIYTNGLAKSLEAAIWLDDGWTAPQRDSNGDLTWNTNIFPASLTNVIKMVHAKGALLMLYSARATNCCSGLPGSPTNTIYRDIQKMMSWGADGCFFDSCDNTVSADIQWAKVWSRIAQQSILDYQATVFSTGGLVKPFFMEVTTGNGAENYPRQDTSIDLFGFNATGWNWQDQSSTVPGYVTQAKDTLKFLGPFIRPGFYPDSERVYAPQMVDSPSLRAGLAVLAMTCQMLRIGVGDSSTGEWTNTSHTLSTYDAGYSWWQMTNTIVPVLGNTELMDIWRDSLVEPARFIWTNQLSELWVRRLSNPDKRAFTLINLSTTNCTLTVSAADLGVKSNVAYVVRNVQSNNAVEAVFANSFSYTVGPTNVVLFSIQPSPTERVNQGQVTSTETATSWIALNVTGTGVTKQSLASPIGTWLTGDGIYQSAANNYWVWNIFPPIWATNFTARYRVISGYSGSVTWTNTVRWFHYEDDPGQIPHNSDYQDSIVTTVNGKAIWITNSINMSVTNFPKEINVVFGACSNSNYRLVIGPAYIKFQ